MSVIPSWREQAGECRLGAATDQAREEYVESELAKRKRLAAEASARQQQQQQEQEQQQRQQQERAAGSSLPGSSQLLQAADPASGQGDTQRVLHGKLFEIDLGDEARARNIEMTERARRRLQGLADDEEQNDGSGSGSGSGSAGAGGGPSKKPRLGKGPRNRRGSDDIQRDQMVEAFLSENKRMPTSSSPINFQFQTNITLSGRLRHPLPRRAHGPSLRRRGRRGCRRPDRRGIPARVHGGDGATAPAAAAGAERGETGGQGPCRRQRADPTWPEARRQPECEGRNARLTAQGAGSEAGAEAAGEEVRA